MVHKAKTQAERSMETQIRLFEATLDCLCDLGYHGASLTQILKRAGVSRGAWSHHFSSKKELIAATAEYVLGKAIETTRDWGISVLPAAEHHLAALFDYIWENYYTGRHRDVWLEFNVACRTDTELRERLQPILVHFHASLEQAFREYFRIKPSAEGEIEMLMTLTINTFRGMAIQSITCEDAAYFKKMRREWVRIVSTFMELKPITVEKE